MISFRKSLSNAFSNQIRGGGLWLCLLIVLSASVANGQVTVENMPKNRGKIYRMKITPAAEPSPIFKHRFSVPARETIAANAATLYLRSFGGDTLSNLVDNAIEKHGDEYSKWRSIDDLPIEGLLDTPAKEVSQTFDQYIDDHIERATFCRYCDWGLGEEDLDGIELYGFLLPSVQNTRSISRVLALQTRVAIAEKRFDRAAELIRMNYQLGRNVGKIKFLVAGLVGIAEVSITNETLVDMIATPGCPNMYYALTELPRPMVDLRDAWRLETNVIETFFPELFDAEEADLDVEAWRAKVKRIYKSVYFGSHGMLEEDHPEDVGFKDVQSDPSVHQLFLNLTPTVIGVFAYGDAKQQLVDDGDDPQKVEAMPVAQVVAIAASRSIRNRSNKVERWIYQPFDVALRGFQQEEKAMMNKGLSRPGEIISGSLLPAGNDILQDQVRMQRGIDALRVIEAIRMHAAQTGSLPETLDEIKVVPVPKNPATNKPFSYQFKNGTATLDLPSSDGLSRSKRFELRL
ncbi:hypothetical protein N9Y42_06900 [Mariniblastus sp.]|nr:hypothetical protein [Mariniblastus sp.]